MKILRPINNNIVTAQDDNGHEIIAVGTGIGFKAKPGTRLLPQNIQKIYHMSDQKESDQLRWLINKLPPEYFELTDEILSHAKETLKKRLYEGTFITLADHINFAVERFRQGMPFHNVLLSEIRRFYPQEYEIGKYALGLMKERLGIEMPDDEAAAIALHIFNAEYDISVSDAFQATVLLDRILVTVVEKTGYTIDEQDYYCGCFISHLKYLTQCVIKNQPLPPGNDELYDLLSQRYPHEAQCCEAIARYIMRAYAYTLPKEELASLLIHTRRMGMRDV